MSNEGSTKDKAQEELKIDELNLAEASTYVHLFTRSCTILGYAVILCLCLALYMKAVSLIAFTDQFYSNGLPKVNLYKTTFLIGLLSLPLWGLIHVFINNNLYAVVGKGLKNVAPSLTFHYAKCLGTFSVAETTSSLIFTIAMSNGWRIAVLDNLQTVCGLIIGVYFLIANKNYVGRKMKSFNEHSAKITKGKIDQESSPTMQANNYEGSSIKQLFKVAKSVIIIVCVMSFAVFYVSIGIVLYRISSSTWRVAIALIIHPLIVECLTTLMKFGYGESNLTKREHPFYDHLMTFFLECILNLFRRFLFNDTNNINITFLLVVLSGFQEILIRSTMEWKESFMRRIMGSPPMSDDIKVLKRKYYSYTVTARSILELVCILISPIMYAFFFNNRYAIDLGYNDLTSIDYESMISSTVLQLCVEITVIYCCSLIEVKNGIPLSDFFYQFRDFRVFGSHLTAFLGACSWILYNFKTVPNSLICSNLNNLCSCPCFSVYQQLCGNSTSSNSTVNVNIEISNLTVAFASSSITIAILSALGLICIITVTYFFVSKINIAKYEVKVQQRHQKIFNFVIDANTANIMEQSSLHQAISTIESLCRGVSPSQASQLQSVIATLKSQAKENNVIDIEEVFKTDGSQDEGTKVWLKTQLMTHEQLKAYNKKILGGSKIGKAKSRTDIPINQKRLTIQLHRSSVDVVLDNSLNKFVSEYNSSIPPKMKGSPNDENLDISSWEFNVFAVECTNPQSWLAWKCLTNMGILEELNFPTFQMSNMLLFVEQNYCLNNYDSYSAYGKQVDSVDLTNNLPLNDNLKDGVKESKANQYHNNLHGSDVFQGVLYFATTFEDVGGIFGTFDLFSVLFAAYIHDFNHPGLNTTYMNSDWPSSGISSTFGTESPLEKHHLAMAFNLMRNDNQYNFLINCSSDKLDYFRRIVTECVLVTDLAKSMPWISSAKIAFKDWRTEKNALEVTNENQKVNDEKKELEYKLLLMQLSIKCADVGHPCRSLDQHLEWSRRIRDEFYSQGDKEREKGMKISPLCDRNVSLSNYPQNQIGFINYVSKPCFMLLNEVCWSIESEDEKPWLKYMNSNIQYWEDRKKEAQTI